MTKEETGLQRMWESLERVMDRQEKEARNGSEAREVHGSREASGEKLRPGR